MLAPIFHVRPPPRETPLRSVTRGCSTTGLMVACTPLPSWQMALRSKGASRSCDSSLTPFAPSATPAVASALPPRCLFSFYPFILWRISPVPAVGPKAIVSRCTSSSLLQRNAAGRNSSSLSSTKESLSGSTSSAQNAVRTSKHSAAISDSSSPVAAKSRTSGAGSLINPCSQSPAANSCFLLEFWQLSSGAGWQSDSSAALAFKCQRSSPHTFSND